MSGKTQAMRAAIEQPAPTGPRWFVVQCHANHERVARQNLINAHVAGRFGCDQFEVYLPMRLSAHRTSRHPTAPFFPRYQFVRFDPTIARWLEIIATVGVFDIVRKMTADGFVPVPIADAMVSRIKSWEIDGVIHLLGAQKKRGPVFKPGDKVKVKEGPFAGYEGLVRIANDSDRVVVMLGLVERGESPHKVVMRGRDLDVAALRTPSKG